MKLGNVEQADALCQRAEGIPGQRLAAAYRVAVDSTLAGLKPARKTEANRRLKSALAPDATPLEVNQFVAAADAYHLAGIAYRGQKTHDKLALDQVKKCLDAAAPVEDFEHLAEVLLGKGELKHLQILVGACEARFPENPFFLFARAVADLSQRKPWYRVKPLLDMARKFAEDSPEPRHKPLLARIDEQRQMIASPLDVLSSLFGAGFDEGEDDHDG